MEALEETVAQMQKALGDARREAGIEQDRHRGEMKDVMGRLQLSEERNEELAASTALATRPLLRQNAALQKQACY